MRFICIFRYNQRQKYHYLYRKTLLLSTYSLFALTDSFDIITFKSFPILQDYNKINVFDLHALYLFLK